MMLAIGEFDVEEMLTSASQMACGAFSVENAPTHSHSDGFGLVWSAPEAAMGFGTFKDEAPLWSYSPRQIIERAGPSLATTKTLAVHARYALLPHQKGLRFTQPLTAKTAEGSLYFLHNGFTPQMHRHLGMPKSDFDSSEFFGVVRGLMKQDEFEFKLCELLEGMDGDTASANFLMIGKHETFAFNWWPQNYEYQEYAQMYRLDAGSYVVVSSEILKNLNTTYPWHALSRGKLARVSQ